MTTPDEEVLEALQIIRAFPSNDGEVEGRITEKGGRMLDACCDTIEAFLNRPLPPPVAWRWHHKNAPSNWKLQPTSFYLVKGSGPITDYVVEPLFTSPPSDKLRIAIDALEVEREWHDLRADLALDEARECSHREETGAEKAAMQRHNTHFTRTEAIDKALAALKSTTTPAGDRTAELEAECEASMREIALLREESDAEKATADRLAKVLGEAIDLIAHLKPERARFKLEQALASLKSEDNP